jgi:hypothetical protein
MGRRMAPAICPQRSPVFQIVRKPGVVVVEELPVVHQLIPASVLATAAVFAATATRKVRKDFRGTADRIVFILVFVNRPDTPVR